MNTTSRHTRLPDLTSGPIVKTLMQLSVPIVMANLLHTAYQLIDTFWVGRLGAEAVAAVSLSFPINFLMISLGGGMAIAGSILVAQYKGSGNLSQVDHIAAQTLLVMFFMSILASIVGFFAAEPIMRLMGAEPEVLPHAVIYLKILFGGMIFLFAYFVFQSLMRGVGNVKTPMLIVLGTVILNAVLDPWFIMGGGPLPAMGVAGAALATLITQGLAAIIGLGMLTSGKYGIHLKLAEFKPDIPLIKKMFLLGIPASVEQSMRALGLTVMSFLVAGFGTLTVAAYGIGIRILSFIIMPAIGIAMATSTLVGQNIGAGKHARAERIANVSTGISFGLITVAGLLLFLFADPITRTFIPGDFAVAAAAAEFVRIMAGFFGFIGVQHTLNGVFMGSGNTKTSMILSIIGLWVFQFPIAYILSHHTTLQEVGLWIAFPVSNVLSSIMAFVYFKTGRWKKTHLIDPLEKEVLRETLIEEGVQ